MPEITPSIGFRVAGDDPEPSGQAWMMQTHNGNPTVPKTVVAIDLGASSGRVLTGTLTAGALPIVECSRFANGPVRLPAAAHGNLQWDILSLWQGIHAGLAEAARRGPVEAIGIDSWAIDYGLLDDDGRLLANPAAYRSGRTARAVEELHEAISPAELYARNGLQSQPFNTIFQLIADTALASTKLARKLLLIPDLFAYWLTGRAVCEVTNASTTGLIDPGTRSWDPELLALLHDRFGVDVPGLLPELVEPGTAIGVANVPGIELRTSTGAPTPVIAVGSHDTASAVAAVPASHGFGFISSGTWSLVGVELDRPMRSSASLAANFTNELGVDRTVRYLKNVMGMWVQQECLRQWRAEGVPEASWDELDAETEAAQPLRTLLDINDSRLLAPARMVTCIDALAQAAGEPVPRNRGEYLRLIVDSLAVAYRRALREASELSGQSIDTVHIVGGGSQNRLLCQLTADATGLPVVAGPAEGTAIGNMLVQLRAIGALEGDLASLRAVVARALPTTYYEPTPGQASRWEAAEGRVFKHAASAAAASL